MKKILFIIGLILTVIVGRAQRFSESSIWGLGQARGRYDSVLYFPTGCGVPTDTSFLRSYGFVNNGQRFRLWAIYGDSCGGNVWLWNPKLQHWQGIGGGTVDTTSLSNRINGKVDNSGGMNFWGTGVTSARPSPTIGPGMFYNTDSLWFQYTDGATWSNVPKPSGSGGSPTDTTSLSNRINLKKDIADSNINIHSYKSVGAANKSNDSLHSNLITSIDSLHTVVNNTKVANLGGSAGINRGAYLSRPSASSAPNTYYFSTDSVFWSYSDGSGWKDLKQGTGTSGGGFDTTHIVHKGAIWGLYAQDSVTLADKGWNNSVGDLTIQTGTDSANSATIKNNVVTNAKAAQMPATTIKANVTGSMANVADATPAQVGGLINLNYLADVLWSNLGNGNLPVYNASSSKWVNGTNWPQEQPWGIIYNKSSWTNLYNFNLNGGLTASLNSGFVDFTPSSNGTYTNFANVGLPTTLSMLVASDIVKAPSPTSTTFGGGGGLNSANKANGTGSRFDAFGRIDFSSNSTAGQLIIDKSTGTNITTSGATRLVWSGGDLIKRTWIYADTSFTFIVQNLTTAASPISLTYNFTSAPGYAFDAPNTCYFSLFFMSALEVQSLTIYSPQIKNPLIVIDGDSKTKGYYCTHWNDRLSYLLNATYGTTTIYAGGYDRIREHLSYSLNDNLRMNARYVIMNIGSNSLRVGESLASVEAQYDSLVQYHLSTGAIVLHMVLPEDSTAGHSGIGLTPLKNYIAAKYTQFYIDTWDSLTTYSAGVSNNVLKSIYNGTGDVHSNTLGNAKMYQAVVASGLISSSVVRTGQSRNASPYLVVTRDSSWIDPFKLAQDDSVSAHTGSSISGLTTNTIPKANSSTSLTNSRITDDGTTITLPGNTVIGATGLSGTVALDVKGDANLHRQTYAFSGYMHEDFINDARTSGVRGAIYGYPLDFGTVDNTATETPWMRISQGGRVLINTLTDNGTDKLQVSGSASFSGNLGAGSSSTPAYGFDLRGAGPNVLHIGNTTGDDGTYLLTSGASGAFLGGGATYNGTNWISKATQPGIVATVNGGISAYGDFGRTVGGTYTPTLLMRLDSAGGFNLYKYGAGTFTGTVAKALGVTSAGKVIEFAPIASIGSFNSTSTANGLDITSGALSLHAADGTNPGAVTTSAQSFAGAKTFLNGIAVTGNTSSSGVISGSHYVTVNSLTLSNAGGTGAGTSPTLTVIGGDQAGSIQVTTGTLPAGSNATIITLTFNAAFTNNAFVTLTPANSATAALTAAQQVYVTCSTTGFSIVSGTTGLTASTAYVWYYTVAGM